MYLVGEGGGGIEGVGGTVLLAAAPPPPRVKARDGGLFSPFPRQAEAPPLPPSGPRLAYPGFSRVIERANGAPAVAIQTEAGSRNLSR